MIPTHVRFDRFNKLSRRVTEVKKYGPCIARTGRITVAFVVVGPIDGRPVVGFSAGPSNRPTMTRKTIVRGTFAIASPPKRFYFPFIALVRTGASSIRYGRYWTRK